MLICEDFWHSSPPYLLWLDGADVFLSCPLLPPRLGAGTVGIRALGRTCEPGYANLFTSFVIHTNKVGFEDG